MLLNTPVFVSGQPEEASPAQVSQLSSGANRHLSQSQCRAVRVRVVSHHERGANHAGGPPT